MTTAADNGNTPSLFFILIASGHICNKKDIKQTQLNAVYKKYLSSEDVFIRDFRVKTVDIKLPFLQKTKLIQELSDCFIPECFMKKYRGLMGPYSPDEVSFARFKLESPSHGLEFSGFSKRIKTDSRNLQ